jgi:hypothetical protein
MMIRNICVLLFFLIVVPCALGKALYELLKLKKSLSGIWIRGFVVELALFELTYVFFAEFFSYNFRLHSIIYTGVMFLFTAIIFSKRLLEIKKEKNKTRLKDSKEKNDWKWSLLGSFIILLLSFIVINIIFRKNIFSSSGIAVETVNTILQSNTVGRVNPYTGISYIEGFKAVNESGIWVFVALLSWLSVLHPISLMETVLPVFLVFLFYAFCFDTGKLLYGADSRKIKVFVLCILFLHFWGDQREWLLFYQFLDSPNFGECMLSILLLPMLVLELVKKQVKMEWLYGVWCTAIMIAILMMSIKGWFYIAVVIFLKGVVYLGRRWWEC